MVQWIHLRLGSNPDNNKCLRSAISVFNVKIDSTFVKITKINKKAQRLFSKQKISVFLVFVGTAKMFYNTIPLL